MILFTKFGYYYYHILDNPYGHPHHRNQKKLGKNDYINKKLIFFFFFLKKKKKKKKKKKTFLFKYIIIIEISYFIFIVNY